MFLFVIFTSNSFKWHVVLVEQIEILNFLPGFVDRNMELWSVGSQVEAKHQQVQDRAEQREQELMDSVSSLEESGIQAQNQLKELKEAIFELEDQVEQQRAVGLHTNQTVLDMESRWSSRALMPPPI